MTMYGYRWEKFAVGHYWDLERVNSFLTVNDAH